MVSGAGPRGGTVSGRRPPTATRVSWVYAVRSDSFQQPQLWGLCNAAARGKGREGAQGKRLRWPRAMERIEQNAVEAKTRKAPPRMLGPRHGPAFHACSPLAAPLPRWRTLPRYLPRLTDSIKACGGTEPSR